MIKADLFPYEGDLLAANAARGTHGIVYSEWSEEPRSARGRSDRQLLVDLATDAHHLPFRHPHVSLRCSAPVPIARQLGKHQVGFEWSEISRRLKASGLTFHRVGDGWRAALTHYSQGSGDLLPRAAQQALREIEEEVIGRGLRAYEKALALGAAPEQARFLLPQSMECLWVWTGSLLGWAELYRKRSRPDTQMETQEFVKQVADILNVRHPVGWPALLNSYAR